MNRLQYRRIRAGVVGICLTLWVAASSCGSYRVETGPATPDKPQPVTVELSAQEQRKYEYFFLEATRLKSAGELDAAFELLKHCLQINPEASSALYEISQFYLFLREPEKAEESLRKAVNNDPDNYWYNQALVGIYQQRSKTPQALEALEQMSYRFPDRQEPLFMLIELYSQTQNYPKVISTLDRLEQKTGKTEDITMEKARIYLQMGEDKSAFGEVKSLVEEYPGDMRYKTLLGDLYLQNDKDKEAYQTYREVLEEDPENAMALFSLATYYEKSGQPELYRQQLDSVLLSRKVDVETKMEVMRQLIVQTEQASGDSTQIIRLFRQVVDQDTDDARMAMLYSQYLISKGMEEEAEPVLWKILQIDPENMPARLQLLGQAIRNNDYAEVIRVTEPAIEITPDVLEYYFYLAIAYHQENREEEAVSVVEKALSITDETSDGRIVSDFYNILGDLYHTQQKELQAFAAYDSALVYNPENIPVLNNYAYYLSLEKRDLDRAEEMSYKTIKAEPNNATYLDTYAWILFMKGRYAEAKIYMDDAMKNGGDESEVVVEHCGDIYFMNGEVEEAVRYWKQALEMGSDSKSLSRKIEQKKYMEE